MTAEGIEKAGKAIYSWKTLFNASISHLPDPIPHEGDGERGLKVEQRRQKSFSSFCSTTMLP